VAERAASAPLSVLGTPQRFQPRRRRWHKEHTVLAGPLVIALLAETAELLSPGAEAVQQRLE
jgi:hypothetical protein